MMAFNLDQLLQSKRAALLLSEVQRSVIGDHAKLAALADAAAQAGVIANSARLAQAARQQGCPVVHCLASTRSGRFGANTNARLFQGAAKRAAEAEADKDSADFEEPCSEVWAEGDIVSRRDHGLNPMADSQLDHRLRNAGISTVIIAGVSLNVAILDLAMTAVNNSYQVIVAKDAVAGLPLDYGPLVMKNTLGFIVSLATTDEIIAAWG